MLLVRLQPVEGIGWQQLVIAEGDVRQRSGAPIRPAPFGEDRTAVGDLQRLQFRLRPARAVRSAASGVFGDPALLDGHQRQMQGEVGPPRRGGEHPGHRGIGALQRPESQFGRSIGMFQRVDQLLGPVA